MTTQRITHGRVTWTNIIMPIPSDVEELRKNYPQIHPLNLEDLLSPIERPKIDIDENYIFVVLHFPLWDAVHRLSRPSEVGIFVGRGFIITIHDGVLKPLNNLCRKCETDEAERQRLLGQGANHAFYVFIDQLVDYIFPILRKVDGNISTLEDEIFTADPRKVIRDIALVRRDVIALRRIIRQQVPIVQRLEKIDHPIIHEEQEEYFGDITDHLARARDIIDEDYEVIAGLAETADTLVSHRINEVIRILTVISVIMLPLTLLSGIYGMNIETLPFKDHPSSFIIVAGIMALIAVGMLLYFRYRHWI